MMHVLDKNEETKYIDVTLNVIWKSWRELCFTYLDFAGSLNIYYGLRNFNFFYPFEIKWLKLQMTKSESHLGMLVSGEFEVLKLNLLGFALDYIYNFLCTY